MAERDQSTLYMTVCGCTGARLPCGWVGSCKQHPKERRRILFFILYCRLKLCIVNYTIVDLVELSLLRGGQVELRASVEVEVEVLMIL